VSVILLNGIQVSVILLNGIQVSVILLVASSSVFIGCHSA
jgi:hypothetical protein